MSEIITVHLDQKPIYDIVIEKDFSQLGTAFSRLNVTGRKICIVTDSNVGPLYAKAVQEVLETIRFLSIHLLPEKKVKT